jgi:TorA maturation chaperone TorD
MMRPDDGGDSACLDGLNSDVVIPDETRATLHGVLAKLYAEELTPEFADELQRIGLFEILRQLGGDLGEEWALPSDYEPLAVEFARLFVGPGPHASPHASVYRENEDGGGQLWGRSTGEVKRFMEHFGLELSKPGLIPDHVSILFEFMERIILARLDALTREDVEACSEAERIQQLFFQEYLEPWIDRFVQRVEDMKPVAFYASILRLTSWFIQQERTAIAKAH